MKSKKSIKFAKDFLKLHGQKTALLLQVEPTHLGKISNEAISYDTLYLEEQTLHADGVNRMQKEISLIHANYEIPDVALLRLTFIGDLGIPFTTYKRLKKPDWEMYDDNVGNEFKLIIIDDVKKEEKTPEPKLPLET